MKRILIAACMILIGGCGGGGGASGSGGGTGGGGGSGGGSQGTLTLSATHLDFTTNDPSTAPPAQLISATITTNASGTLYLKIVEAGQVVASISNITILPPNGGQATIDMPSPSTLGPGRFTGTLQVTACTSGPNCSSGVIGTTQTVDLTYTINGVTVSTPSLDYTINDGSVAADYSRQLSFTAYPGYTVSSDSAWVHATPASGAAGATQLTVDLDRTAVDNGESGPQLAHLNVTGTGGNTVPVPVNLVVAKPQIDQVTPYVGYTGSGATVTVRGQYLDQLTNTQLDFAPSTTGVGVAATNVIRVSPTELMVTYPALVAGKYLVRMHDAAGGVLDRSHAHLAVIDRPVYAATTLQYPFTAGQFAYGPGLMTMVYDAERQALLVGLYHPTVTTDQNTLLRYTYSGNWSAATSTMIPALTTFAFSANGEGLLVSSMTTSPLNSSLVPVLAMYSPDLTSVLATAPSPPVSFDREYLSIAFTSENHALLVEASPFSSGLFSVFEYSPKANLVSAVPSGRSRLSRGSVSASGDGQRLVFADLAPAQNGGEFSIATDSISWIVLPVVSAYQAQLDRTGAIAAVCYVDGNFSPLTVYRFKIFDRSWNLLGEVTTSSPLGTQVYALAPDGTRLYVYTLDNVLHTYDLASGPVGGSFAEIGTGTALAGDPGAVTGGSSYPVLMAITPDGGTVFIGSGKQIVVQPVH